VTLSHSQLCAVPDHPPCRRPLKLHPRARSRRLRFRHSDKPSTWRSQSSSQAT